MEKTEDRLFQRVEDVGGNCWGRLRDKIPENTSNPTTTTLENTLTTQPHRRNTRSHTPQTHF
jgi:hypothetical protein